MNQPVISMMSVMNLSYKNRRARRDYPANFEEMQDRAKKCKDLYRTRSEMRQSLTRLLVPAMD